MTMPSLPNNQNDAWVNDAQNNANALAKATTDLAQKVSDLAVLVEINNAKIDDLQKEIKRKPDDAEVALVRDLASKGRVVVRRQAIATALISAVISSSIAFSQANHASEARCRDSAKQTQTLISLLGKFDVQQKNIAIQNAIIELNKIKVC